MHTIDSRIKVIIWGVPKHVLTGGNEYLIRMTSGLKDKIRIEMHEFDNRASRRIFDLWAFIRFLMASEKPVVLIIPSTLYVERFFVKMLRHVFGIREVIVICQDLSWFQFSAMKQRFLNFLSFESCKYVGCSNKVRAHIANIYNASYENISVINPGNSMKLIATDRGDFNHYGQKYILCIADVTERKQVFEVVSCFLSSKTDLHLIVCGSVDKHSNYFKKIDALCKGFDGGKVEFLGRLDQETLQCYISHACAVVHSAKLEAFGMGMLESLCSGTPVLGHVSSTSEFTEAHGFASFDSDSDLKKLLENESYLYDLKGIAADDASRMRIAFSWMEFDKKFEQLIYAVLHHE